MNTNYKNRYFLFINFRVYTINMLTSKISILHLSFMIKLVLLNDIHKL